MPVHRTLRATISLAAALLIALAAAPARSAGEKPIPVPSPSGNSLPLPAPPAPPPVPAPKPSIPTPPKPSVQAPDPPPAPPPAAEVGAAPAKVGSDPAKVAKAAPRGDPPSIEPPGGTASERPGAPSSRALGHAPEADAAASPRGQSGRPDDRGAPQRLERSGSLAPARAAPASTWVAYVWSAVALTQPEALLSTLQTGLRLATALAAPELLPLLLSPRLAGEVAGARATAGIPGIPGPADRPRPRFEGSTDLSLPSASQISSAVLLLVSLALLASLPFMLRRELTPPRRRPL